MLFTAMMILLAGALIAFLFSMIRMIRIFQLPVEHEKLKKISGYVADGAMAFLTKEYQLLLPVIAIGAIFIWIINNDTLRYAGFSFVAGAVFSALAGFVGMKTATAANSRTAHAAQFGISKALKVAFGGGSVTGLAVIGLALLGIFAVVISGLLAWSNPNDPFGDLATFKKSIVPLVIGFALGASAFALFARVGGGIFTKAADVGADLVGKLEAGIPEDDHRNPAVIADNVGDNVGDLAGMAADLFSSFVGAVTGAIVLAIGFDSSGPLLQEQLLTLPFLLGSLGVVASILGVFVVRVKEGKSVQTAINRGTLTATVLAAIGAYFIITNWVTAPTFGPSSVNLFWACVLGLAAGVAVSIFTEFFTAQGRSPVEEIVKASNTGPATNIITGMGMGMLSNFPIVLTVFLAILGSFWLYGMYGVAIAVLGMLVPFGIQMAISAYGPIADNAGGLAEMSEMPSAVRDVTDRLDAVGNTTSAIGKGYAISSTAMTAVILFAAFKQAIGSHEVIELLNINVVAGLLLGGMIPFVFASMNMNAIGKSAFAMIEEVRRQFREKPGILEETESPDYKACVSIATQAALQEMVVPGLIAVIAPIVVGFVGGIPMLLGLLAGTTVTAVVMGIFMTNTGGAWDNAKKSLESKGSKGTDAHKAAVVGDTVGDPFKDTAGPSLNILIKLMAMVALLLAPNLQNYWHLG